MICQQNKNTKRDSTLNTRVAKSTAQTFSSVVHTLAGKQQQQSTAAKQQQQQFLLLPPVLPVLGTLFQKGCLIQLHQVLIGSTGATEGYRTHLDQFSPARLLSSQQAAPGSLGRC